ncbi:hypothetical protein [Saccharicrinis aurantiacus]|uniref:hypothetical protein n=1 Tax=Saccharicrinis aurantiacus TaxID=1849719 RepID=UPI00094F7F69|nr:hypothetical protein [Saccharicrinis aurantiacus]
MLKNLVYSIALIGGIAFISSCSGNSSKGNSGDDFSVSDSALKQNEPLQLSEEIIGNVIQNISSPVEMASLIKKSGVDFSQKILNKPEKVKDYNTSFKRALNLGVYSADLGYINTFDKNTIVVSYLLSVKELSEGIKVGQFFDFAALKKMATNSSNLDSLMEVSVSSFNKMDSYLREQKRSNVSSLIVTGAWIEGLYISSQVIEETNNEDLINRIGEQKDIIDILLIIMNNYSADPNFAEMVTRMEQIKQAYQGVKITTEFGEPKRIERNGTLIIVQDEISHVEIAPESLTKIIKEIKSLRDFIIS